MKIGANLHELAIREGRQELHRQSFIEAMFLTFCSTFQKQPARFLHGDSVGKGWRGWGANFRDAREAVKNQES